VVTFNFKVIHPRWAVNEIYVFPNVRSWTAPCINRVGDMFRLVTYHHDAFSSKKHSIKPMKCSRKFLLIGFLKEPAWWWLVTSRNMLLNLLIYGVVYDYIGKYVYSLRMHKTTRRHICTVVLLMVTVKRTLNIVLALHNVHLHIRIHIHTYIHTYWHGIALHDIMHVGGLISFASTVMFLFTLDFSG